MTSRVIQGFFIGGAMRPQPSRRASDKALPRHPTGAPPAAFAGRAPPLQAQMAPGRPPLVHKDSGGVAQPHGGNGSFEIDPIQLGLAHGGGKPLPGAVLAKMEAAFGADFSAVRVHVGPQASRIGAIAFTTGNDLYFAPGRYQPESVQGQQLIGHELAHVIQQREGRVRAPGSGVAVVQDRALEAEADRRGMQAAMYRPAVQCKAMPGAGDRPRGRGPIQRAQSSNTDNNINVNTDNWQSDDLAEERANLHVLREMLAHTLHHKTPRQLLGYFWAILSPSQKLTFQQVLDVAGRKGFLSMASNLLLGPKPEERSDEPGLAHLNGQDIAKFDGNPAVGGSDTPRSSYHRRAYDRLLVLFQLRANAISDNNFHAILHLLEQAELLHYRQTKGAMLEDPTPMWTSQKAKAERPFIPYQPIASSVRDLKRNPTNWDRYANIATGIDRVGVHYSDAYSGIDESFELETGHTDYYDTGLRQRLGLESTRSYAFETDPVPGKRSLREQQQLHRQMLIPGPKDRVAYDQAARQVSSCHICGSATTLVCSRCHKIHYCGKPHQRADWPRHKQTCVASH